MESFIVLIFLLKTTVFLGSFVAIFLLTRRKKKSDLQLKQFISNVDYKGSIKDAKINTIDVFDKLPITHN
jgi:hypothetical protein